MASHPVRLLVLDKRYLYTAPPWPPLKVISKGQFSAHIYEMPLRITSVGAPRQPSVRAEPRHLNR
jgi:hypothetical protein